MTMLISVACFYGTNTAIITRKAKGWDKIWSMKIFEMPERKRHQPGGIGHKIKCSQTDCFKMGKRLICSRCRYPDSNSRLIGSICEWPAGYHPQRHCWKYRAELAHLNEQLAHKNREKALYLQAEKKRGLILLLSFMAMLITINIKNEILSIALTGGCMLAALIILYRNLSLLTKITTENMKIGTLKVTTLFNMAVLIFAVMIAIFNEASFIRLSWVRRTRACLSSHLHYYAVWRLHFSKASIHPAYRIKASLDRAGWRNMEYCPQSHWLYFTAIGIALLSRILYDQQFWSNYPCCNIPLVGIPGLISFVFWWKKLYGKH